MTTPVTPRIPSSPTGRLKLQGRTTVQPTKKHPPAGRGYGNGTFPRATTSVRNAPALMTPGSAEQSPAPNPLKTPTLPPGRNRTSPGRVSANGTQPDAPAGRKAGSGTPNPGSHMQLRPVSRPASPESATKSKAQCNRPRNRDGSSNSSPFLVPPYSVSTLPAHTAPTAGSGTHIFWSRFFPVS